MGHYPYFFQKCMLCYGVQKVFLGPVQTMHAQNKMFENLTVAQTTGRKSSVAKFRKLQNVLGKDEIEYCTSERKIIPLVEHKKN